VPVPGREPSETDRDKVTIYEVARRAGVSIATVSHTLNRPDRVGADTRIRVLQAVDDLGFVRKADAANNARRGVGRIAVLAPFSSYQSYLERLVGVLQGCEGHALDVVVFDEESAAASTSPQLDAIPATGRVDGLIIMGLPLQASMAERLTKRRLPTVLVDSSYPGFSSVTVDDVAGGYLLGTHLVQRGRRRFAYVGEPQRSTEYLSQGQMRMSGLMRALRESGIAEPELNVVVTTNDVEGGRAAADDLLDRDDVPDAVFAHHDDLAAGIVSRLRERGVSVPADVAVAGYDGNPLAEALGITTVRQPFRETGGTAVEILRSMLSGGRAAGQSVSLIPELVVRSTT
jgi:DNA-binding LacI/PurR family transcriptional regulator